MTRCSRWSGWVDTTLFALSLSLAAGSGSLAGVAIARTRTATDRIVLCACWALCADERPTHAPDADGGATPPPMPRQSPSSP